MAFAFATAPVAFAGPPYATDDPEPVPIHHWELYLASQHFHDDEGWSGTAPHFEANYGLIRNLQLHLLAPMTYLAPPLGKRHYGYGDTELGAKFRFIQEGSWTPQIGTFPFLEIPTGSHDQGLGNGKAQVYVPLWLQKSFGKWTTYGGAGYWIHPGEHNRNWLFVGWQAQRQLFDGLTLGAEIFHVTPKTDDGKQETGFNAGGVIDVTDHHHVLLSAGRAIHGPTLFSGYAAYQLTFGPQE